MMIFLLIVAFFTSWGLVFVTTPLLVKVAKKAKLFDIPSERKVHETPTPRIGGLALFTAFLIPFLIFYCWMFLYLELPLTYILYRQDWLGIFVGAILIFLTGFLDDLVGISSRLKLIAQCMSAIAVVVGGLGIEKVLVNPWGIISLNPVISALITIIWCLLVINGFNFIDGLDGLAAGIAFICGLFLLIVAFLTNHYYITLPVIMLAGATIGFLHYNFNPARIFMGDSGSYFLGYALVTSALRISRDDIQNVNIVVPVVLILALPVIDVVIATLRRILKRQPIFKPDCQHIHHCILNKGFSHRQSVLILYGINFLMGLLALSYFYLSPTLFWSLCLVTMIFLFIIASNFGYFDWIFNSNAVISMRKRLKETRFQMTLLKDLWILENTASLVEMRKRLVVVLARLNLDHAKLTIFSPPLTDNHGPGEVIYSGKSRSEHHKNPASLQLNIPLIRGKKVYGYLFVEKNAMETSISYSSLLTLLERTTQSLVNYILKNRINPGLFQSSAKTDPPNIPHKQTYILIAKGPAEDKLH